ncbi:putative (R)-mandelonitrile lyase [Helianthus anomalus]
MVTTMLKTIFCIGLQQKVFCFFHHHSCPGTAGCALATTLSESYSVLLLERGRNSDTSVLYKSNILRTLATVYDSDSPAQNFVSEDGVQHTRARILGCGCMIIYGFYSRADDYFYNNAGIEWDMGAEIAY